MDDAATTRSPDSRAPPALRPEFEDFFRSRFAQVARAMMLAVHDRDLGEQIAQEAFTRLYEHWPEIESEDHAVRFAYRTALNLAASHHRRERRWRSRRAEPSGEPTPGPEETVATRLEVFAALSLLSPKQRACVVLVDYSGFDDRSAAELRDRSSDRPGPLDEGPARSPRLAWRLGRRRARMTADPFVKGRLSAAVDVEPIDLETHLRTVIEGRDAPARLPRSWRWPVAAGALAAAVAAVALAVWAFSSYRAPPPAHRPTPTPRTASPHVGRLVFVAAVPRGDGLGPDSIYLLKPGARRATRLYGPLTIAGVAGSPDGRYVAFSRGLGEGEGEILISSVMGGLLEHVTRLGVPQQPAWSPEGSEIAFTTGKSIHVIQTDGGGLRPVTHPGRTCDDLWPAWSPNALRIAFVRECVTRSGTPGLYVVAANGTGARVVVATGHVDGISWSPDGQTIAFASGAGAGRADDIRFLDPSTGRVRDLTPDPATETRPAWSPDGEWIGFIRNGRVFAMHPDGSDSQVITGTIGLVATYLAWMPAPEETPIRPSPKPTPTEEPAGSFSPPLAAVAFVDAGHGWIAGTGVILGTSDGGRTWTRQYGGPADITQLEFVDSRHGWAVGRRELLVTRDGGQTWTRAGEPSSPVSQVHFLDDRRGWGIVGNAGDVPRPVGRIVATSDGGATWNPLPGAPQASALCFVSSSIAYAASGKEVFASADGGGTWTTTFDAPMLGRGWTDMLSCSPDGEVWLLVVGGAASCQEAYVAFHSADGRNWTPIAEEGYFGVEYPKVSTTNILGGYTGPVAAIAPGRAAYVGFGPCGDEASVSLTENGGRTFEGIKLPAITRVAGVSFADSQHGWIVGPDVGGHGVAYRTGDGGRTWTRVEIRI